MIRSNDRVLITGASSGIGRELAAQLGARGCRLALSARRAGKLAEAAAEAKNAGAADVITLQGSVGELETVQGHSKLIVDAWGGLDCAILNAGVGDSVPATKFSAGEYRWTFETNVFGVCNWLECVIPIFLEQSSGLIAGVSSPAGWAGFPGTGSYCASKAAVTTLMESVRIDLRDTGIDVVTVCPGFVKSEITDRNDPNEMIMLLETDDGVRRMLRGLDKRRRTVHFPFPFTHFLRYGIANLPRCVFDPLMSRIGKRTKQPYVDESQEN